MTNTFFWIVLAVYTLVSLWLIISFKEIDKEEFQEKWASFLGEAAGIALIYGALTYVVVLLIQNGY